MSRNQRIGLLAAAALVAVVAIVVAVASGGTDDSGSSANTSTQTQSGGTGTTTTSTTAAPQAQQFKLQIKGGNPVGGVQDFKVKKGDKVVIVVTADAEDDIHVHGVDIEKPVEPGKPTTFRFTADTEGIFDIESHKAEDAGREPQMAKLTVEPD
jgi:FtsP/CotA-like multicopper oxidase with cupredoxin domain